MEPAQEAGTVFVRLKFMVSKKWDTRFICFLIIALMGFYLIPASAENEAVTYPDVSCDDIYKIISENDELAHPYLFAGADDFQLLRQRLAKNDPYITGQYEKIKVNAAKYLSHSPEKITSDINTVSYFSRASDAIKIVMYCAFIYLAEGDESYAQRAFDEAMYFAGLSSWGTYQYIDNNQVSLALAVCYDWLYDWLGTKDGARALLVDAIRSKHLDEVSHILADPQNEKYSATFYRKYYDSDNHSALNNCYTFLTALAVSDTDAASSAYVMSACLTNLQKVLNRMSVDSGWYEGVSYWNNVGPALGKVFASMDASLGTSFGYTDISFISDCPYFPMYAQSSVGCFVYNDSVSSRHISAEMYYFGKKKGDDNICRYVLESNHTSPLMCLWYDGDLNNENNIKLPKDRVYSDVSLASMRSSWSGEQEIFTAMSVQNANLSHAFMNSGTFVLDALGERWITNPGRDEYTLNGYWDKGCNGKRWQYYCTRAEANSCVVINPSEHGGQTIAPNDKINVMQSSENEAFCIADLSATYEGVNSYRRGLKLFDNRSRVMLRDEIVLDKASQVYSFINLYNSDIQLTSDGVILAKGSKKLYVKITSDRAFTHEIIAAAPLSTSPNPEGQMDCTKKFKRLSICFDSVDSVNVNLEFVPYFANELPDFSCDLPCLDLWSVSDKVSEKPLLSKLLVNGNTIDGFNPEKFYYSIYLDEFDADISAVTDEANDVMVIKDSCNSCYKIYVTNSVTHACTVYYADVGYLGKVTADAFVGGSLSEDEYMVNKNYGSSDMVVIRDNSKFSLISYYKIKLPSIPKGKKIDKLILALNQYRRTSEYNKAENFELYLVDSSYWSEDTISYNNAPIRHSYSDNWYPFCIKGSDGTYSNSVSADISFSVNNINTISRTLAGSDNYYQTVHYDITPLLEKATGDEISFVIGIPFNSKRTLATNYIASKEHSDLSLHPALYADVSNLTEARNAYVDDAGIANYENDKLYFMAHAVNNTDYEKSYNAYIAMYSNDNVLLGIKGRKLISKSRSTKLFLGENLELSKQTAYVKLYVFDGDLSPAINPDKFIRE